MTSKLIIIRGNSGSGKTTIAAKLRTALPGKIALINQDYVCRTLLGEADHNEATVTLIDTIVRHSLLHGYDVILEGILRASVYGAMLARLAQEHPNTTFFYLDVSLDETIRRHAAKPNAHEFGAVEMRQWYMAHEILGLPNEITVPEASGIADTLGLIQKSITE